MELPKKISQSEWNDLKKEAEPLIMAIFDVLDMFTPSRFSDWYGIRDGLIHKLNAAGYEVLNQVNNEKDLKRYAAYEILICGSYDYQSHPDFDLPVEHLSIVKFLKETLENLKCELAEQEAASKGKVQEVQSMANEETQNVLTGQRSNFSDIDSLPRD